MNLFEKILLRLKEQLKIQTDKKIAELLNIKPSAFNDRKKRDSFPIDKLLALIAERPDLKIDVDYVLTGKPSELMTRREAIRLGILEADPYVVKKMKEASSEDDGDESKDDEPFNINTLPTYRLSKDEWELMKRYRCASLEMKFKVMQLLMTVDMTDKTTDDYKPEPVAPKSAQHFHGNVTGEQFAAGNITNNTGKKRK